MNRLLFKSSFPMPINNSKGGMEMNTTPKNKNELINGLKNEKNFLVLGVHTGPAIAVAKEVAKLGSKTVSVVITASK